MTPILQLTDVSRTHGSGPTTVHALRADLWRRYVTLFFDGLGAPAPRALPSQPAPNGGFGR